MASIRKRGNSYLIVVSMGYTPDGRRRNPQQKTVKPPKSTLVREKQDIERFKLYLGSYKLADLRPEHFRSLYTKLRKQKNKATGKPLPDAMEGGYLDHNPAWRTYKYAGQKKEKKIADDETVKKLIQALETASILHETYFKLIIATGMRRGECCALKWADINYAERSIHVCRNAVKTTGDEIIVKAPKTKAGKRSSDRPERPQPAPHGGKPVHRQRHGCRHSCWIARSQSTVDHAGYLYPCL